MRVLLCVFLIDFADNGAGSKPDEYGDYAEMSKKIGMRPPHFDKPVPFGHITREGFGDPYSFIKQPIDNLEIRLRMPKDKQEALELLERRQRSEIVFLNPNIPKSFARPNPKEEMLMDRQLNPQTNHTVLKWYDLAAMQTRNAMMSPKTQFIPNKIAVPVSPSITPPPLNVAKHPFFSEKSYQLANDRPEAQINWTSCDEFAVGAVFSPKDIVNLKWTPFYIWGTMGIDVAVQHTFEYPSSKLVNEYHSKYGKILGKKVDWTNTKLLMKGMSEALLIAADKRGLFDVIAKHEIPESTPTNALLLPSVSLRIKIEDPYLVLTYCENYFATLMAVSGNEPTDSKEMKAEAATIKFEGPGKPVWRDYAFEKQRKQMVKEADIAAENDKIITIDGPMPPVGQWD